MRANDVDARLRAIGKDRHWLATATGYTYFSLRDCLAPKGKGVSERMAAAIGKALEQEESRQTVSLEDFTDEEKSTIAALAAEGGFPSPGAWVVALTRAVLALLGAKPSKPAKPSK